MCGRSLGGRTMKTDTRSLIAEIDELRKEVKMLRDIVQSLMYVISEEEGLDSEFEEEIEERYPFLSRIPISKYVS